MKPIKKFYKRETIDFTKKIISLSPNKFNFHKKFSDRRHNSISIEPKDILKMKKMEIFNDNKTVDLNMVKYLDKKNKKYMEILNIINKNNNQRDKNEKELLINFLLKTNIREIVKDDLEIFNLNIKKYLNYILEHISLKEFFYLDIIYYDKDTPNNFYLILNDSNVGEYELNITEELLDFEEYFLYLSSLSNLYEKYKEKKVFLQKININDPNEDISFMDSYLLKKIIDENNKVYSILSYNDIRDVKEILIKIKIYNLFKNTEENINIEKNNEEEKEEDKFTGVCHEQIIQIHKKFNADLSLINYDKVIYHEMTYKTFISFFKKSILSDTTILHYIKYLNNPVKNYIKKMNYKKIKNHKKLDYFGNFSCKNIRLSQTKNFGTRKLITKSETNNTLVLCFNKREYFIKISNILKEEKEKNIIFFHDQYIFKVLNMEYFTKKIFPDFKLHMNTKGDKIFLQNQKNKNLIMLKEGIIELQMQNTSLLELGNKIKYSKNLLLQKINDIKNITNTNKLMEQILDIEIDNKTNLQMNFVKEIINKKLNIVFSRCSKGFFGEYECFYNIPSLLTGVVVSESSEEYFYSYHNYKQLNSYTFSLNEKLEVYSFNKFLNLLKRMCNIYNSYWKIFNNQYSNLIKQEDIKDNNKLNKKQNNDIMIKNNIDNISKNIKNQSENDEIYFKMENNKSNRKISQSQDIKNIKNKNSVISKIIFGNKFQRKINNSIESIKNDGIIAKNKMNQIKEKKEKKFKIRQWDFNIYENKFNSLKTERLQMKNLENMNLMKNKLENNRNKTEVNSSTLITNNFIKNKITKINRVKKIQKINKNVLKNIFLPPILKTNSNINERNNDNFTPYSTIKSDNFNKKINFEDLFNNEKKTNKDNIMDYFSKSEKKKHDIKKVSINFLKSRKKKYFVNLNESDEDDDISWGEEYYYTNQ